MVKDNLLMCGNRVAIPENIKNNLQYIVNWGTSKCREVYTES